MEHQRLTSMLHQTRQAGHQPAPTWIVVAVVAILALDICILADLLTGHTTCALRTDDAMGGNCAAKAKNDWLGRNSLTPDGCFRAAVFENNRIDSENFAERIQSNLGLFDRAARIASSNGAKIIVFPEDGIVMGSKSQMEPHLQEIPDPELLTSQNNNPCLRPDEFEASAILRNLSCIARETELYVVANFGTRQNCEPGKQVADRQCPEKGFFALNTDVVLDPWGNFIKRYRKYNLFFEIFDHPPALEEVYFDTPLGRFGVFTCFDLVFERPAIDLVEKHKVDTILFPTWWYDEAPMLTATLSQEAWSRANQVNLLAANMFRRNLGSVGSGIYSGNETVFTTALSNSAKLLIANVARNPKNTTCASENFLPVTVELDTGYPVADYRSKNYELQKSDTIFTLHQFEDKKTVCSGKVCCTIDYKIRPDATIDAASLTRMVLIARDANRLGMFNFYEQVCVLATLERPVSELASLNETVYSREPLVGFEKLSIQGTFETRHVFPVAGHAMTLPVERKDRHFECRQQAGKQSTTCEHVYLVEQTNESIRKEKIYSFGLYGRVYDRDIMPEGWKW